jgi:8-oxo-dGTP pyrophosphatase MutT (NUDIX family)
MEKEKVLNDAVLCFLERGDEILFAWKTRNIGKDRWNGYGGGINDGESPEEATVREMEEEGGVIVSQEHLEKVAIVDFHNTKSDGEKFVCKVHIYLVHQWLGEPKASKDGEMINPTWFKKNKPPEPIMPADKKLLSFVLSGKKILARVWLGPFQQELLKEVEIEEVDSF